MKNLYQLAKSHYTDLPYHNFNHALRVRNFANKLIKRSLKYKIVADKKVIEIAALFHDAGYTEVENNKEEHSAQIAVCELRRLGYSKKFINQVKSTIMATKDGYPLKTVEQKILRAADLSSFAQSYNKFMADFRKIEKEYQLLHQGKKFPVKIWVKLVERYLKPQIKLTPEYKKDDWHTKVRKNIQRYLETLPKNYEKNPL